MVYVELDGESDEQQRHQQEKMQYALVVFNLSSGLVVNLPPTLPVEDLETRDGVDVDEKMKLVFNDKCCFSASLFGVTWRTDW